MKRAFTLSETLTVLMVIGIIAAMTIPVLMTNIGKQKNLSMLKKLYASYSVNIQQSLTGMDRDSGYNCGSLSCTRAWGKTNNNNHLDINGEVIGTHKHNGLLADLSKFNVEFEDNGFLSSDTKDTLPKYPTSNGGVDNMDPGDPSAYILRNTAVAIIYDLENNCNTDVKGDFRACSVIIFDTNGKKGPNRPCQDRYAFYLANEKYTFPNNFLGNLKPSFLVPYGYNINNNDFSGNNGYDCTAKIVSNNWKD